MKKEEEKTKVAPKKRSSGPKEIKVVVPEKVELLPTKFDPSTNRFIVQTNIFQSFSVKSFSLPKMLFSKFANSDEQKIKEKSSIAFELWFLREPNEPLSIVKAAKEGIEHLKLLFLNDMGAVVSTWEFKDARVSGIDFGVISYEDSGEEDSPWNTIKVEVEFEQLLVDGFEV